MKHGVVACRLTRGRRSSIIPPIANLIDNAKSTSAGCMRRGIERWSIASGGARSEWDLTL
jgi:hypothetical protein